MKPRFLAATGIFALAGVAALIATPASAKKRAPYARGEIVVVTGVVTDAGAGPLAEVEVVFAASRHAYDYLRLRKRTPVERRTAGQTASDGSFEIDWPWDDGFNHFELLVGITVAEPGGEYFHVLHQEDLSDRMRHGSPVVSTVQIKDTGFLKSFREFRAGLRTETQRRVYREAGKPDKVRERVSPSHIEVDWWYFGLGKVYRFRDGEITEVETFEPVQPFDS